jgi:hypothetical protein
MMMADDVRVAFTVARAVDRSADFHKPPFIFWSAIRDHDGQQTRCAFASGLALLFFINLQTIPTLARFAVLFCSLAVLTWPFLPPPAM